MSRIKTIADGKLRIAETKDTVVSDMERKEVAGKIAEIQTEIDHMNIDMVTKQAEKAEWVADLAALDA